MGFSKAKETHETDIKNRCGNSPGFAYPFWAETSRVKRILSGMKDVGDAALDNQKQLIVERQEKAKEAERIKIERDRQHKEKARLEAEVKRLKGVAWSKYYQEPQDCLVFQSDAHMVECVDSKKKARKEFDRLYDQGKIR